MGAIQLKMADEQRPQVVLIGKEAPEKSEVGEVVYVDDEGVICSRWNYRQAGRMMIDADTINGIFYFEGLAPIGRETIEQALNEFCMLAKSQLSGKCNYIILSKDLKSVEL